jgi:hydrogenase expression/formation protein HypE
MTSNSLLGEGGRSEAGTGSAPARPLPFRDARIEMAHGAGGKASRRLVEGLIAPLLGLPAGEPLTDAATLDVGGVGIALTADTFVVRPLRFPGGSIGDLAVNGTVNDLAVSGARPLALLVTLVIEAGLPAGILETEMCALGAAAGAAAVAIVGGDTKVVEHGKADGLYVTTAGIGCPDPRLRLSARSVRPGDRIVVSGPIGDHGITVLLARGDIDLECELRSDTRAVWPMVDRLAAAVGGSVHWMRDPTRGGVATALNELARDCGLGIIIDEDRLPVRDEVRGACELLGLDPLHIANEGQFLAVIAEGRSEEALDVLRAAPGGQSAAIIGEVCQQPARTVLAVSGFGGSRVVDMLVGDPLPRIC